MNAFVDAEIERPPAARSFTPVIPAGPPPADARSGRVPPPRTHPDNDRVVHDDDRLHHRPLRTHKPRQYPVLAHAATCLPREPAFEQPEP